MGLTMPISRKIDAAKNKVFTIRYVGLLGETYDIRGFLEALGKLAHTFEFQMEFIGNVHPYVQKLAQSLGLGNNIRFLDYLPHSEALDAMRAADALLLIIPRTKRNEAHFSGKLYEYMATGNPILNIGPKNGEPAQMIEELGCGFTADYDDADGIAETLRQWATEKKLPVKPAQASKNHPFSRFSLTEKLAGLLQ